MNEKQRATDRANSYWRRETDVVYNKILARIGEESERGFYTLLLRGCWDTGGAIVLLGEKLEEVGFDFLTARLKEVGFRISVHHHHEEDSFRLWINWK